MHLALNKSKVVPGSALTSMPGLGLLGPDPQAPLGELSGLASFSKAVSLTAEPGLTLLPAVLIEEDTVGSYTPL